MPIVPGPSAAGDITVGELIDRVLRDYLEPPDELWVRTRLTAAVDHEQDSWEIDLELLGFEEAELLSPGALVEVDGEQAIVTDLLGSTLTVRRGARGTEAASHDDGSEVLVSPAFTRLAVFHAVAETIVGLHPPLFTISTTEEEVGVSGITPIPEDAVTVTEVRRLTNYTFPAFEDLGQWTTGRAIRVFSVVPGEDVWITYRGRFAYPASEGQALSELGIRGEWGRIIVVGAAAQLISSRPLSTSQQEFVSSQLRVEGYPVETPLGIRDALISYHEFLLNKAASSLVQQHPAGVVFT